MGAEGTGGDPGRTSSPTLADDVPDAPKTLRILGRDYDAAKVRRYAVIAWAVLMVLEVAINGLAWDRNRLILLLCLGMIAASIGSRRAVQVIIDWLPFALILLLYDFTRDVARVVDMPTQWHWPNDVDNAMFGVNLTVWFQEHLKEASAPWWEVLTSLVYVSYFIVPYAVAAVLWLRDRSTWRRYAACFIATTFLALIGYTLVPAAPPWAAARCTADQLVDHPRDPVCMYSAENAATGGILGTLDTDKPDVEPYVERISSRGWEFLNIKVASNLIELGQGNANLVAAIPSLHGGLTMLLALFMWPRVKALGRSIYLGYAFAMAFTLVYTAEHYVIDILLGWGLAALVVGTCFWVDRRWLIPRRQRREAERDEQPTAEPSYSAADGLSDTGP